MEFWKKSRALKEYLKALKKKPKMTPELEEYIELGQNYADRLNPLNWQDIATFDEDELRHELPYSLW